MYLIHMSIRFDCLRLEWQERRTDLVRAIVLVIRFADLALKASPDLGADANTLTNLDGADLGTGFDDLANDLVTDT